MPLPPDEVAARAARLLAGLEAEGRASIHPGYGELEAWVDGRLPAAERARFERHLAVCASCTAEAQDLETFARAMRNPPAAEARGGFLGRLGRILGLEAVTGHPVWVTGLAAAVILVALLPLVTHRERRAGIQAAVATPAPPPEAGRAIEIRDGGLRLALEASGTVSGAPPGWPPELTARVASSLERGELPLAPALADLRTSAGTLLGASPAVAELSPLAPLGVVVASDRPAFRWSPLAGAESYVVEVFDDRLERIARSPRLSTPEWSPERALPRGTTLVWQVRARTAAGEVIAPRPPAPEAKFRVLGEEEERQLAAALAAAGGSRLARAVVLAGAGLAAEAAAELATLEADNPGVEAVARLRRSLASSGR